MLKKLARLFYIKTAPAVDVAISWKVNLMQLYRVIDNANLKNDQISLAKFLLYFA